MANLSKEWITDELLAVQHAVEYKTNEKTPILKLTGLEIRA